MRPADWMFLLRSVTQGPMLGKLASAGIYGPLKVEATLDPKIQPFLHDHQIDGTPVLPGVMGIEAFAEAALCLLPGWHIEALEDVNFTAPFKFYRNEARTVTVEAMIHPARRGTGCRMPVDRISVVPESSSSRRLPRISPHAYDSRRSLPEQLQRRHWARRLVTSLKPRISIGSIFTGLPTRLLSGRGGMESASSGRWPKTFPKTIIPLTCRRSVHQADRIVLPDRRGLGDGH